MCPSICMVFAVNNRSMLVWQIARLPTLLICCSFVYFYPLLLPNIFILLALLKHFIPSSPETTRLLSFLPFHPQSLLTPL